MDAPYTGLARCKRCFESLVIRRQEGWALCSETMKPRAHLTGNFSMKYWSNGPSSLLWTDWCSGCSWSLLGENPAFKVQIGIAYNDFRCLTGSGAQVLAGLETVWRVQTPDLGATSPAFSAGCCWDESSQMVQIPSAEPSGVPWDAQEKESRFIFF